MKKQPRAALLLVLGLSVGAVGSGAAPVQAAEAGAVTTFWDVTPHDWFAGAVTDCVGRGLLAGMGNGRFDPQGKLTRAQAAAMLYRLAGSPAATGQLAFADTDPGAWYAPALSWAVEHGLMTGYSPQTFGPNDPLTREQMMRLLMGYLDKTGTAGNEAADLSAFSDASAVSEWAQSAVSRAVARGLLAGADGKLLPQGTVTRAQGAAFLQRVAEAETEPAETEQLPKDSLAKAREQAAAWVYQHTPQPVVSSVGGEWAVLGLTQSGYPLAADYTDRYLQAVTQTLRETGGVLSQRKYTEYARVALALTALGENAQSFAGYDVVSPLTDTEAVQAQGINGPVWALLALDSGRYLPDSDVRATYVQAILDKELPGGGWSFSQQVDADVTAMALQALAGYRADSAVEAAVQRGLARLAAIQSADGDVGGSAESNAQVLLALARLGVSRQDSRFVKNGNTVADALLTYQRADGGFAHIGSQTGSNPMATEQALLALAAQE